MPWDVEKHGKALACKYLERCGMDIIAQDFTLWNDTEETFQKVDIVGYEDGVATLVDVRAYVGEDDGKAPKLKVECWHNRAMREAVLRFIRDNAHVKRVRHDVVAVRINGNGSYEVNHLIGAVKVTLEEMDL